MQRTHQPFARAMATMELIATAMAASVGNFAKQKSMLDAIPPYISRGKGEGRLHNRSARGAGMAAHRAAMKKSNVKRHRASLKS